MKKKWESFGRAVYHFLYRFDNVAMLARVNHVEKRTVEETVSLAPENVVHDFRDVSDVRSVGMSVVLDTWANVEDVVVIVNLIICEPTDGTTAGTAMELTDRETVGLVEDILLLL